MKKSELKKLIKESIRTILKEGSYDTFIANYGQEIKTAIQQCKEISKIYNDIDFENPNFEKECTKIAGIYDKGYEYQIDGWFQSGDVDIQDIANTAIKNQDKNGTEPHFLLDAINDFARVYKKYKI